MDYRRMSSERERNEIRRKGMDNERKTYVVRAGRTENNEKRSQNE